MSKFGLLLRSLLFHWRTNLAVLLGCAVGSAVLTGALLVGDSMRGSLRRLTELRLGEIDFAVVGGHFFTTSLAQKLADQQAEAGVQFQAAAAVAVTGSAANAERTVAPKVNLIGTTQAFWRLFHGDVALADKVCVNQGLAEKLSLKVGDRISVSVQTESNVPREGLLGERDSEKVLRRIPFDIEAVVPDEAGGRFALLTSQAVPMNLYAPIERLASALEQPGRANALFISTEAEHFDVELSRAMTLDDYGVEVLVDEQAGYVRVESRRKVLDSRVANAITTAGVEAGASLQPVLAYLANTISAGDREVPYSIVAAVAPSASAPLGPLPVQSGAPSLRENEILLNRWTAEQLQVQPGAEVVLKYFVVDDSGAERETSHAFKLAGVVEMEGIALDRHFTPDYPGITDADTFNDWDPPFPFDSGRVRPVDEEYWDKYRTAPKAFVGLQTGQELWSTRYGNLTSIRMAPPAGRPVAEFAEDLKQRLLAKLKPRDVDMAATPVKQQAVQASSGSTDFGGLFIGFSFFLIASAVLLVGLLFRLNTERRASQIGLMLAVGLGVRRVRRLLVAEGLILAAVGGAIGLAGSFWYAQQMIEALNTDWQAAVSTPFLSFYWTPSSLWLGYVISVAVAFPSIWWGVGRLGKIAVPRLLHRGFTFAGEAASGKSVLSGILAVVGLVGGVALAAVALVMGGDSVGAFFGAGILLLVGALAFLSARLRRATGTLTRSGKTALARLGVRNGGRYPARSVLTAGLLAFATFVVVAVGAMRHGDKELLPDKSSGNGGFSLIAESSIPIHMHLNAPDAPFELNLSQETEAELEGVQIEHLRVREGEDASCLNVYQPEKPTLLGVSQAFIERGGFAWSSSLAESEAETQNPWTLLNKDLGPNVIPAIGDANTMQWILKKGLDATITLLADNGQEVQLRLVGSLSTSIFQGELVVSEANMLRHFPSVSGYKYFLFETPAEKATELQKHLETDLADYGLSAQTTWERIAAYKAVENTYMGSFQTLGGFGLILGTIGLGTVLFRNVMERRGELGLMRALGFRKSSLAWLVLAENVFLLVVGVLIGTVCALIAVSPQLARLHDFTPLLSLAALLLLVLVVGVASGLVAVVAAMRTPLITALRTE